MQSRAKAVGKEEELVDEAANGMELEDSELLRSWNTHRPVLWRWFIRGCFVLAGVCSGLILNHITAELNASRAESACSGSSKVVNGTWHLL